MVRFRAVLASSLVLSAISFAQQSNRQVAITIDDLPRGGDLRSDIKPAEMREFTRRFLAPLKDAGVPFTGFVNEGRRGYSTSDLRALLGLWLDSSPQAELGSHTFSHPDLNRISLAEFETELRKGEQVSRPLSKSKGRPYRYFRHPFLHTGLDLDKKRGSEAILKRMGYQVAPVTIDNSDYLYALRYQQALTKGDAAQAARIAADYIRYMDEVTAFFEKRSVEVVGREFPQILLIHANELNRAAMPDLLAMFRKRGYAIVQLEKALADPAYQSLDTFAGDKGISWIHRWGVTKGMPIAWEPDPPKWIMDEPRTP